MQRNRYLAHCLNNSPSKEAHAFGKAQRFRIRKSYGQFKYTPSELHTRISITFGCGDRDDYQKIFASRTPSPDKYRIKSQFDDNHKGYTFGKSPSQTTKQRRRSGLSRQLTPTRRPYKGLRTSENTNPEVAYQRLRNKLLGVDSKLQERHGKPEKSITPNRSAPGPGAYNAFSQFSPLNYYR